MVAPFSLGVRRLGERTCVVNIGTDLRRSEAPAVSEAAGQAAADGCRDFVFDLTYVRRYERVALGWMADLWGRLGDAGCEVFVAARGARGGARPAASCRPTTVGRCCRRPPRPCARC